MPAYKNNARTNHSASFEAGANINLKKQIYQVNAKANYALSQLNAEKKVKESTISTTVTTTPVITAINGLVQGTTVSTRVGDTVRWTGIQFRARLDGHATVDNLVRLVLIRDHTPKGVGFTYQEVFEGSPSATNIMQYRNLDNYKRFDIIWDKFIVVPAQSGPSSHVRFIEKYWDLEKMVMKSNKKRKGAKYDKSLNETNYGLGNAGTLADIAENSFSLLLVSDNVASPIDFDCHFRLRYIDN